MKIILLLFVLPLDSALSPCSPMPQIKCNDGEERCPAEEDENGCPLDADDCLPVGKCDDSSLPVKCPEGMLLKQGENDTYCKCPEPDVPTCNGDQMWCDFGNDKNDCYLGGKCVADCGN